MQADEIRKLLHANPFRAFTVYLASDKSFFVPHQDFAMLTPKGRTLIVSDMKSEGVDLLDVALISRIEVKDPT